MTQPFERTSRRRFVKLGTSAIWTAAAARRGLAALRPAAQPSTHQIPAVDGELMSDATSREMAASDFGGVVNRLPRAVLRPASVADVRRIVTYANRSGVKLSTRGRGHSYAPALSGEGWREHYGAPTWRRFAAAKRRFDPNNILTPGAGIFS